LLRAIDTAGAPFSAVSALWMKFLRRARFDRMPVSRRILTKIGVLPVRDHYFEPFFNPARLRRPLGQDRELPGLDLNVEGQAAFFSRFQYEDELLKIELDETPSLQFFYHNGCFGPGDAEYWYSLIRLLKPRRIVEIGSGFSTLLAVRAIRQNELEDGAYSCALTCIEPFERPWLEKTGARIVRERAEVLDKALFLGLDAGDVLFIDSSHVIRPQGDVLFEYLEILPLLKSGVIVHIHDIYTPQDYPEHLVVKKMLLWNEQYLLEAFLTLNDRFRVIGALNFLKHHRFEELSARCPILRREPWSEPGSFYIQKT